MLEEALGGKAKQQPPLSPLKKEITMVRNSVLISKLISLYFKCITSFKCLLNGMISVGFCSLNVIVSMVMPSSAIYGLCLLSLPVIYGRSVLG